MISTSVIKVSRTDILKQTPNECTTRFHEISNNCEIHKMQPPSSNDEEVCNLFNVNDTKEFVIYLM